MIYKISPNILSIIFSFVKLKSELVQSCALVNREWSKIAKMSTSAPIWSEDWQHFNKIPISMIENLEKIVFQEEEEEEEKRLLNSRSRPLRNAIAPQTTVYNYLDQLTDAKNAQTKIKLKSISLLYEQRTISIYQKQCSNDYLSKLPFLTELNLNNQFKFNLDFIQLSLLPNLKIFSIKNTQLITTTTEKATFLSQDQNRNHIYTLIIPESIQKLDISVDLTQLHLPASMRSSSTLFYNIWNLHIDFQNSHNLESCNLRNIIGYSNIEFPKSKLLSLTNISIKIY
jgi:hypothetical protein